jgi:pyruvate dehydrogenase E2 component (dihydrolipoamide acetyltransferase)
MAHEIKMPQLSDTMDSGKILEWNKKVGDNIERGDILAIVETDKANLEIESFVKGTLLEIIINENSEAAVGEVIAIIGEASEKTSTGKKSPEKSSIPTVEAPKSVEKNSTVPDEEQPNVASSINTVPTSNSSEERKRISPLAKKIAENNSLNLSKMVGSGPGGRIIKRDIETALDKHNVTELTKVETNKAKPSENNISDKSNNINSSKTSSNTKAEVIAMSKMRATIAKRMVESVTTSPHFYVTSSIRMDEIIKLRTTLKNRPSFEKVSINHFIIKAVADALKKVPAVNAAMKDEGIYQPEGIHIGIVTAVTDGLLIPVIKDADKLSLTDIAFEAKMAIERARAGRPTSQDLSGGTFSISNMGMYDVENFTAIISPGQGAILAVGSTKETPIVCNGTIKVANIMKVTLSSDHRIIDGVTASTFLTYFKEVLETPVLLFT